MPASDERSAGARRFEFAPAKPATLAESLRDKRKTCLTLAVLLVAALLDWNWPWSLIFVYWTLEAVRDRETYLVEEVPRDAYPVLFWLIVFTWLASAAYLLALDIGVAP